MTLHILTTQPLVTSSIEWLGVRQHLAECASFWAKFGRTDIVEQEERDDRNYRSYDV
jgi:hypothetical protein